MRRSLVLNLYLLVLLLLATACSELPALPALPGLPGAKKTVAPDTATTEANATPDAQAATTSVAAATSVPPTPAITDTPLPPNCQPNAAYVQDVTVPDGTKFTPGQKFTKTWRIKSTGCAAWPKDTRWVFVSGNQMGGPANVSAPSTAPGKTADISVELQAPTTPGSYKGFWQMQMSGGKAFGEQMYVEIVVPAPTPRVCPAKPSRVSIINQLDVAIGLSLSGPQKLNFSVPAKTTVNYCLVPGDYQWEFSAPGYKLGTGTRTLESTPDGCKCWWWNKAGSTPPECNCNPKPSLYVPPPLP